MRRGWRPAEDIRIFILNLMAPPYLFIFAAHFKHVKSPQRFYLIIPLFFVPIPSSVGELFRGATRKWGEHLAVLAGKCLPPLLSGRGCDCRGLTAASLGNGLSGGSSGGLMPRQIHRNSALSVLICSLRAAMATMRSLSIADLAGATRGIGERRVLTGTGRADQNQDREFTRGPAQKVGQFAKMSFTRNGAL